MIKIVHGERFEKSVISSLMQEGFSLEGAETLTPDHFYNIGLRNIFIKLSESISDVFDLTHFTQKALETGSLESLGGPNVIAECYTFTPSAVHFYDHVKELHVYKARRMAIKAASRLLESAQNLASSEDFINAAGEPMTDLLETAAANQSSKTKKQILRTALDRFEERVRGENGSMGWATGLQSYDQYLKGLHPQQITVLSGFPSSGKTVLAGQILWEVAKEGIPSLMISLEMPADKIVERIIPLASDRPAAAISDPLSYAKQNGASRPTKEHLLGIKNAFRRIHDSPIEIEDPSNASIAQVLATIRKHARKNGVKVVAVDYLQLIRGNGSLSREQQMSEISHSLQGVAKELGLSMILLSQQNKEGGTKHAEAIAEDADTVLSILQDRDKESDNYGKHQGVMIRKDRHNGNTGVIMPIYFDKPMIRFSQDLHIQEQ